MVLRPIDSAAADTLPLRAQERIWGFSDILWVQSGLSIASWSFLIGGVTATFVGFFDGLWTMLVGNCIGVIPMLLATALPSNRWGTEHFVTQRAIYGARGVIVTVAGTTLTAIGWIAILAVMLGESAAKIAAAFSVCGKDQASPISTGMALVVILFSWLVTTRGIHAFGRLNRYAAPGIILLTVALLFGIFWKHPLAQVLSTKALSPRGDHVTNTMLALELNIAAGMSWWSLAANISRSVKTERITLWAGFLGYVPVAVMAQTVGLVAALMMSTSDPTDWIVPTFGRLAGFATFGLIGFANLTSIVGVAYASLQTMIQHGGPRVQRLGWNTASAILFAVSASCIYLTGTTFYDRFFAFVAWSQALIAPAIGVTLADYYLLRRMRVSLFDLYDATASGHYYFWNQINYAALFALVLGAITYAVTFNPVTLKTAWSFNIATASLPAMGAGFVVHVLLTKIWVVAAQKGTYSRL